VPPQVAPDVAEAIQDGREAALEDAPPPTPPPAPPVLAPDPGGGVVVFDGGADRGDPAGGGSGDESSVVNSAWAATQGRMGWNYRPTGQVVAVGWTDELDAPVTPSSGAGPARSSRSAVVARATVTSSGERLTDAAVVRSLVRGPITETPGGEEVGGVWAFYLPESVDGRPVDPDNLVMNPASSFVRAELWTPDGWEAVDIPENGQTEVAVPAEAVVDGVVLFRWAVANAVPAGGGRDLTIYEKETPR
jgi:hypothetical protein